MAPATIAGPRCRAISHSRRLDGADQSFELIRRAADVAGELADHLDRPLRLADLDELVDEVLVGLQGAQQAGELAPCRAELAAGALGFFLDLAPLLDQESTLLRL